ncbi:hypothetical protein FQZ97_995450 [compost metagenome]
MEPLKLLCLPLRLTHGRLDSRIARHGRRRSGRSDRQCRSGDLDQRACCELRQVVHGASRRIDDQHADHAAEQQVAPVPAIDAGIQVNLLILIAVLFQRDEVLGTVEVSGAGGELDDRRRDAVVNHDAIFVLDLEVRPGRGAGDVDRMDLVTDDAGAASGQ